MADAAKSPPNPFWDFTLAVYRRDGVSAACIALQDRLGLDVNFLLLCVFAGAQDTVLSGGDLARLEMRAAPWRQSVIHPLRQVRRWLKDQTLLPREVVDALRRGVLAQEIEAEGMQQSLMGAEFEFTPQPAAPGLGAAARNLARYLAFARVSPDAEDVANLATLLSRALAPEASRSPGDSLRACLREAGVELR